LASDQKELSHYQLCDGFRIGAGDRTEWMFLGHKPPG